MSLHEIIPKKVSEGVYIANPFIYICIIVTLFISYQRSELFPCYILHNSSSRDYGFHEKLEIHDAECITRS